MEYPEHQRADPSSEGSSSTRPANYSRDNNNNNNSSSLEDTSAVEARGGEPHPHGLSKEDLYKITANYLLAHMYL